MYCVAKSECRRQSTTSWNLGLPVVGAIRVIGRGFRMRRYAAPAMRMEWIRRSVAGATQNTIS